MTGLLRRTVRFCVGPAGSDDASRLERHNTFAGWPPMVGLGAHYELDVTCRGRPNALTGYVLNIADIDRAVRDVAVPMIAQAMRTQALRPARPTDVLRSLVDALLPPLDGQLASLCWRLTPYHSISMSADDRDHCLVSQHFEFAASHRLHVPSLSDEENRRIFGKCNHPSGHGHNYRLLVSVEAPIQTGGQAPAFDLAAFERVVDQTVIQRFDHKHLNVDTKEFHSLNPSVENIAKVCHDLLAPVLASENLSLRNVTLWETSKTSYTYPAGS